MNNTGENRRDFIRNAFIAAVSFPILVGCKTEMLAQKTDDILSLIKKNAMPAGAEGRGAIEAPDNVSWKTRFGREKDIGEPMIISGTVFQRDGKTPAPNILIYAYHTDAEGYYGRNGEAKHGRFRGWMLTDSNGQYEFTSIKPASYPNRTFAAHVHMTLTGPDFKEDSIDSILFEGDRFLTPEERVPRRGGFNPVLTLEKDGKGILRGVRNIQLWKV